MKRENKGSREAWERELDRRCADLPNLEAPEALIPRVLERLRELDAAPWWHQAWWAWPRPVQVISVLMSALGVVMLSLMYVEVRDALAASYFQSAWREWLAAWEPVSRLMTTLGAAAGLVMERLCGVACIVVAVMCLCLYLSCVGLGTVLYRLWIPARINA